MGVHCSMFTKPISQRPLYCSVAAYARGDEHFQTERMVWYGMVVWQHHWLRVKRTYRRTEKPVLLACLSSLYVVRSYCSILDGFGILNTHES